MTKYVNATKGLLVLPGGVEVRAGFPVPVSAESADNPAVALWISNGSLVKEADYASAAPPADVAALTAQLAESQAEVEALKAQLAEAQATLDKATVKK